MINIRRVHPGIYIKEYLDAEKMNTKEFSKKSGISETTLSAIIDKKCDIDFDIACSLSKYFDNSVDYWTNLQEQYNIYLKNK